MIPSDADPAPQRDVADDEPGASGRGRAIGAAGRLLGGASLAALLLWWVLRGIDLDVLGAELRRASVPGLALGASLVLGHMVPRVWRWRSLLAPVREGVGFAPLFQAIVIGYAATMVVPGRIGELVRPALLSGREKIPLGPCLGTVVVDRLLDLAAVLILFGTGVLITPLEGAAARHASLIRTGSLGLLGVVGLAVALLFAMTLARPRLEGWLRGRDGAVAWLLRSLLAFARGTEAMGRPRLLAGIVFHSLLAWGMIATGTWIGVRACGVEIALGPILVMLPLLVLGAALPTPAGAGGYHAAMTFGLTQLFGVANETAVGASLMLHLATTMPFLVLGAAVLWASRISLRYLLEAARQVKTLGAASEAELGPASRELA